MAKNKRKPCVQKSVGGTSSVGIGTKSGSTTPTPSGGTTVPATELFWARWACMWVMLGRLHARIQWAKRHGFRDMYAKVPHDPTYTLTWNFSGSVSGQFPAVNR